MEPELKLIELPVRVSEKSGAIKDSTGRVIVHSPQYVRCDERWQQWLNDAWQIVKALNYIASESENTHYSIREEIVKIKRENEELKKLLTRYRDETPLGHQPHMIAHIVDKALGRG